MKILSLILCAVLGASAFGQTLTNGPVSSLTRTSATLSICPVSLGSNSTVTLYWSKHNGYQIAANWSNSAVIAASMTNNIVSTNLTTLTGLATWYYTATASNNADGLVWGNVGSLTTPGTTGTTYAVSGATTNVTISGVELLITNGVIKAVK
jgi:hypothetical protein